MSPDLINLILTFGCVTLFIITLVVIIFVIFCAVLVKEHINLNKEYEKRKENFDKIKKNPWRL